MTTPRLYISPDPQPNAFATGRNEKTALVCVTAGLLQVLDRDEVRGVVAHEVAHIRNKDKRRKLANRLKDPKDPFRIVIVRDMWLTGFDAPSCHTVYSDKPMKGAGLWTALARRHRVGRDRRDAVPRRLRRRGRARPGPPGRRP